MADSSEVMAEGKHLRLMRLANGWEFVERVRAKWAAVIVAQTKIGEIILVEQFRPPMGCRVLELPAGLIGDEIDEEDALDAARRELLEETGFTASTFEVLAKGPVSPGLSNELIVLIGARGAWRERDGGGVDDEEIATYLVPLNEIREFLKHKETEGVMVDPKIFAGVAFVRDWSRD